MDAGGGRPIDVPGRRAFGRPAQESGEAVAEASAETDAVSLEMFAVNNVWMMVATFLVFIMHLGFASLESVLTRAKNTVNILCSRTRGLLRSDC